MHSSSGAASSVSRLDKPSRPDVIQCSTEEGVHVTKVAVHKFFSDALAEGGLVCELEVGGHSDIAKRFPVFLKGPGNVGKECVDNVFHSRQGPDGEWKEFFIPSPLRVQVQLYFDLDTGPRQTKLEITTSNTVYIQRIHMWRINPRANMVVRSTGRESNCIVFCVSACC